MESTQNKAIEKVLSTILTEDTASELANLEGKALEETFECLYEQMDYQKLMPEAPTATSLLRELYELTEAKFVDDFEIGDLQYQVYAIVETLAELLGIDLE